MKRPAALCASLLFLLSLAALYTTRGIFYLCAGATLALGLVWFFASRRYRVSGDRYAAGCLCILVGLFVLHTGYRLETMERRIEPNTEQTLFFTGQVVEEPEENSGLTFYIVQTEKLGGENMPQRLRLQLISRDYKGIETGDILIGTLRLESMAGSPYRARTLAEGIYASGYLDEAQVFEPVRKPAICYIVAIREFIRETVFEYVPAREGSILLALTIGDQAYIGPTLDEQIRSAGVSHVMVVSGLHLSILSQALYFLTSKLGLRRRTAAVLQLLLVFLIMAICGFTMSIQRAGLTYLILAIGTLFFKQTDGLNSLSAAVVLILLFTPFAAGSVSFLLSVAATYGILVPYPIWMRRIDAWLKKRGWDNAAIHTICSLALTTIAATLCTMPICIYYFGYISVIAVLVNMLISHAVSAALIATVAALLLAVAPLFRYLTMAVFFVAEYVCRYVVAVIRFFGDLPFATVPVPREALAILAPLTLAAVAGVLLHRFLRARRLKGG